MCRDVVCPPLHAAGCLLPSFACMAGLPSSTAHARTQRPVFVPSMPILSGSNAPTCFALMTSITHHAGGGGSLRSLSSTRHTSTCTDHRRTTRWAAVSSLALAQSTPAVPCEPPTGWYSVSLSTTSVIDGRSLGLAFQHASISSTYGAAPWRSFRGIDGRSPSVHTSSAASWAARFEYGMRRTSISHNVIPNM